MGKKHGIISSPHYILNEIMLIIYLGKTGKPDNLKWRLDVGITAGTCRVKARWRE
jgi:hypothetical protein